MCCHLSCIRIWSLNTNNGTEMCCYLELQQRMLLSGLNLVELYPDLNCWLLHVCNGLRDTALNAEMLLSWLNLDGLLAWFKQRRMYREITQHSVSMVKIIIFIIYTSSETTMPIAPNWGVIYMSKPEMTGCGYPDTIQMGCFPGSDNVGSLSRSLRAQRYLWGLLFPSFTRMVRSLGAHY